MGLLNSHYSGALFTQAWVDALKSTPERGMAAEGKIYLPNTAGAVFDPITNTYTSAPTLIYQGKMRVQPVRGSRQVPVPGNPTYSQLVQFQIPIDEGKLLDLRPKHRVEVTLCPLNPMLTKYLFAVQEVLDSSNPLERTFYCTVNLETVVN